jgi:hypothetical protein
VLRIYNFFLPRSANVRIIKKGAGEKSSPKATHNLAFSKKKEMGALPMSFRMGRAGQKEEYRNERIQKNKTNPF